MTALSLDRGVYRPPPAPTIKYRQPQLDPIGISGRKRYELFQIALSVLEQSRHTLKRSRNDAKEKRKNHLPILALVKLMY
jgi:hypothetical protein